MTQTEPDPVFARVHRSFTQQAMMATLGARLERVAPGQVVISAEVRPDLTQQQGAGHAALAFAIGDSAAGYAALSVMEAGKEVLTAEMKINLLAPASGRLRADGRVIKAGRRLVVVAAEVTDDEGRAVAVLQGTMVPVDVQT